jgi:hypothetical protein
MGEEELIVRYEQFVDTVKALQIMQPKIRKV